MSRSGYTTDKEATMSHVPTGDRVFCNKCGEWYDPRKSWHSCGMAASSFHVPHVTDQDRDDAVKLEASAEKLDESTSTWAYSGELRRIATRMRGAK